VKAEHRHLVGLLQPHAISESKWEVISMDFIVGFPLKVRIHDSMFLVFDSLTKSAHFIHVRTMYQAPNIARVFISDIVRLHERIISDRGSVFTGRFWTSFQEALGTQLNFSTAYHPETNGQTEITNQFLEDMLRMYVMDQHKRWEELFPLVEFAYNNGYQRTIKMAPFEFLYG
jgi:hypothetical protein